MDNKYIKRASASFIIKAMQIKTVIWILFFICYIGRNEKF